MKNDMGRYEKVFVFFILILLISGCASKKYVKKAFEYETVGLKNEALELYCKALDKDEDNIDAKLGAKRLGQEKLNTQLATFYNSYSKGDNTAAVSQYHTAQAFFNQIRRYGVELDFPAQYLSYYDEAKSAYIEEKYYSGCQLLEEGKYSAAEKLFREVSSYSQSYKDVREKLKESVCEPLYKRGVAQLGSQKYKEAYDTFSQLLSKYHVYKDVQTLQNEAKDGYVEEQYALGCAYMESENFSLAETAFKNVIAFKPNYKEANDKLVVAIWEPQYRKIATLMKSRQYRSAYALCTNMRRQHGDYKQSAELAAECFERATVIMVVPPITNSYDATLAQNFRSELIRSIQNLNNEFVKIAEFSPKGKTLSRVVVLDVKFVTFKYLPGTLKSYTQKGWYYDTNKDIFGQEKGWKKVEYYEYDRLSSLDCEVRHRIIDNANKNILREGAKSYQSSDYINYASYDGNAKNLYPGSWKHKGILGIISKDGDYIDYNNYETLQRKLFKNSRTIKSYSSMCDEVLPQALRDIVNVVSNFMQYE